MRIELPIESERLVIRPLRIEDADDLREDPEWIQSKIDRFELRGLVTSQTIPPTPRVVIAADGHLPPA